MQLKNKIIEKLESTHWEELDHEIDPSKAYDLFYNKLFAVYDDRIRIKKSVSSKGNSKKSPG